jgi:hypothetical protein
MQALQHTLHVELLRATYYLNRDMNQFRYDCRSTVPVSNPAGGLFMYIFECFNKCKHYDLVTKHIDKWTIQFRMGFHWDSQTEMVHESEEWIVGEKQPQIKHI